MLVLKAFRRSLNHSTSQKCSVDQAVIFFHSPTKPETKSRKSASSSCQTALSLIAATVHLIDEFKAGPSRKHVEVTNLGELHWMLGVENQTEMRHADTIHTCPSAHTYDSILRRFYNFDELKPLSTPMDPAIRPSPQNQSPANARKPHAIILTSKPYRESSGIAPQLGHLSHSTRH